MGMYGGHYVYTHNDVNEYKYGMDDDYYRNDNDGIDDDTDYGDDCYGD